MLSLTSGSPPFTAFRQSTWAGVQSSWGSRLVVRPMSPEKAWAFCWFRLGWPAFQPKRPSTVLPAASSQTWLGRPTMPAGLSFEAPALARMAASGMASSRPRPIIGGATRAENIVCGCMGP